MDELFRSVHQLFAETFRTETGCLMRTPPSAGRTYYNILDWAGQFGIGFNKRAIHVFNRNNPLKRQKILEYSAWKLKCRVATGGEVRNPATGNIVKFDFPPEMILNAQSICGRLQEVVEDLRAMGLFDVNPIADAKGQIAFVQRSDAVKCSSTKPILRSTSADLPVWRGWDEYREYWDGFVKEWYECKERAEVGMPIEEAACVLPNDELTSALNDHFAEGLNAVGNELNREELPEPYCGERKGAKFIIVQMNPGAAQNRDGFDLEATKYYSNREDERAFLIRDFDNECKRKFSEFNVRWSLFKNSYPLGKKPEEVCGHDWWWVKDRCNRRRWIKSFSGCDLERVFDFEMIPYHSKGFNINDIDRSYLLQRVMLPAGILSVENKIPCVVFCGGVLRDFLLGDRNATLLASWENGWCVHDGKREKIDGWPDETRKWYKLFRYQLTYVESDVSRKIGFFCLSISANNMKMPAEDFQCVEKQIHDYLNEFCQRQGIE